MANCFEPSELLFQSCPWRSQTARPPLVPGFAPRRFLVEFVVDKAASKLEEGRRSSSLVARTLMAAAVRSGASKRTVAALWRITLTLRTSFARSSGFSPRSGSLRSPDTSTNLSRRQRTRSNSCVRTELLTLMLKTLGGEIVERDSETNQFSSRH
ncbi:Protein of unknown function [Gryllus bimaculatus]|nr:Protein of unknown function [Gryllus bimaculatus]